MRQFKDMLKNCGYNARERANVYAGAVMGVLAPIAALRYTMFPVMNDLPWYIEAPIAWGVSTVATLIPVSGMPIAVYGFATGSLMGGFSANQLRGQRADRQFSKFDELKTLEGKL